MVDGLSIRIRGEEEGKKTVNKNEGERHGKDKTDLIASESESLVKNTRKFFENFIWLNTKETAEYLRTNPRQIRKWVYQGRIKAYKLLGKSLRFKKRELDLLLEGERVWE